MSLVAIDLSLRMAGLVLLNHKGHMMDFKVIQTKKELFDDELLLLHLEEKICSFIDTDVTDPVTAVVMEGLSFGSKSSRSDLIAGNWWHIKAEIRRRWPDMLIGVIPVTTWRSKTVPKEVLKEYKQLHKTDPLKKAVVDYLPEFEKERFLNYIAQEKLPKASIYDLADAWSLGQFRLTKGKIVEASLPF